MKDKIKKIILKKNKQKILCLTSYSKNIAEILDRFVDIILVGDSLGSVLYNYNSTRKVLLRNMIEHSKSVRMGIRKSLMVVDMPFQTYRTKNEALSNAKKLMKITKCDAVKLEGGKKIINIVDYLIKNKIPVMGHIGILPQSVNGKFRFKGKNKSDKKKLISDAQLLEERGVFSIVLECIESSTSMAITKSLKIPTIGIGSSSNCDGQVLVTDDMIGLNPNSFRFVKKYGNVKKYIESSVKKFRSDVLNKKFPKLSSVKIV